MYIVTDIEVDGPIVGQNSMMSFASVAIDANGIEISTFQATLEPLNGTKPDPDTIAWLNNMKQHTYQQHKMLDPQKM